VTKPNIAKENIMSRYNNTTKSTKYKHLTERERYTIETLLKEKLKPFEIA